MEHESHLEWNNPDMKTEILYVFSYMVTLAFHPSMCATIEVNRDEAIRK